MNINDFYNGNEWNAHEYFGAHPTQQGVTFRVYAPHAKKVTLIGSFNAWHDEEMQVQGMGGIYTLTVEDAHPGQLYKYRIYHMDGTVVDKADPYGFGMEVRPCSASVIVKRDNKCFTDEEYLLHRDKLYNRPMNIYEIHFGSWKTKDGGWYRYEELGQLLIPYLKEMGYTHVEIMPLNEHPLDASWGYQSTGFFAPTSRYGNADGLKQFVNDCHMAGIGVILDFVMVHFAVDSYGLNYFDGSPLYELPFDDVAHSEWGSYNFAHGRGEVASFLKSCANYWISEFHFDGLRMDAVSNIIYWSGNAGRGVNQTSLSFVRSLNEGLHNLYPNVMLIAEDSSNYLKVTAPVQYDGLGFDYKWDLGFMHDTLEFFSKDVNYRRKHYDTLLFSMHYFYNELYLLAFSHDENVHGKKTILDKMYGSYEEKFANVRALYVYMMTHPGKKLNFMGGEIGQFREWAEYRQQDFDVLLQYPLHRKLKRFVKDLNFIYQTHEALYDGEYNAACFHYIINAHRENVVYAYERCVKNERILVVLNFSDINYFDYEIRLSGNHRLKELINSDSYLYGGKSGDNMEIPVNNGRCRLNLPAFSGRMFVIW